MEVVRTDRIILSQVKLPQPKQEVLPVLDLCHYGVNIEGQVSDKRCTNPHFWDPIRFPKFRYLTMPIYSHTRDLKLEL